MELKKKYLLYRWDRDAIIQYGQDYSQTGEDVDEEFYTALESNQRSIMEYGELLGEYFTEDEALSAMGDYTPHYYEEYSIWDVDNRCWFN